MRKRVVLTGLGAITAAGESLEALWQAYMDQRSHTKFLDFPGLGENDSKPCGALIPSFVPEKYISQRKALKVMARDIQLAVGGASLALLDAGATSLSVARDRFGVVVGSGVLNHELNELASSIQVSMDSGGKLDLKKFGEEGIPNLFPLWLLKYLPNMSACHISILFDLQGPNNTITTGATGGLQAIGEAIRIIERGAADTMLAGGAESKTNPVGISQYQILGALCPKGTSDLKKAYCPLDEKASGFVVGEGAGFVVLEELEHAKKRGARIYAEVTGFGASSATGHEIAMKAAIRESSAALEEIDYLQASGVGIVLEDEKELSAIQNIFGDSGKNLSVSTLKPIIGFTGYAAGALDFIASALAIKNQAAPPVANFEKSKNKHSFQIVKNKPVKKNIRYAMTNAFGFKGQCTSLVIRSFGGFGFK